MSRVLVLSVALLGACKTAPVPETRAPVMPTETGPIAAAPKPETPVQPATEMYMNLQTAAPQELVFPAEEFRHKQPTAAAPRPFRLPKVKPFTLKNGIKAYLVEQHTLPLVSIELSFDGGSATDPAGKEGLASVCMAMLTEGTEKLDKIQYSEALADVASNIGSYASDDLHAMSLSSLTKHLDATFALFVDTLRSPGLRQSDFDRMIKRRIESVRQSKGTPASVAGRVNGSVLFGRAHPFGAVTTEASLSAITLDDCKAFASTRLKPQNAQLFVVGDLTEAQVRSYFEGPALAAWKGAAAKPAALPKPSPGAGRVFFVHIPGAAQSQVAAMHLGPRRTATDYFPTSMLGAVFGGSFSSRINMNLREDKGYSYGARGGFSYSRAYGTFSASASVRTDSTYQTLLEIDRELKELWKGGRPVTKEELEREKQGAILGLPGRFATGQAALGQYRSLVYYGLPLDYFNSYVDKLGRVTESQVKNVAARHLRPGQAVYLVVGDGDAPVVVRVGSKDQPLMKDGKPVTLRAALTDLAARGDLGQGGLVELDPDGVPVTR